VTPADRETLAAVMRINGHMGEAVTAMLGASDPVEDIPVQYWRELAKHVDALSSALHSRIDAVDPPAAPRLVIDPTEHP
jgi:hypothetical protein